MPRVMGNPPTLVSSGDVRMSSIHVTSVGLGSVARGVSSSMGLLGDVSRVMGGMEGSMRGCILRYCAVMLRLGTVKSSLVLVHGSLMLVLLGSRVVNLGLCWVSLRMGPMAICCSGMGELSLAVCICCENMLVSRMHMRGSVFMLFRLVDGSDIVRTNICAWEVALRSENLIFVCSNMTKMHVPSKSGSHPMSGGVGGRIIHMGDWSDVNLTWSRTMADSNMRLDLLISRTNGVRGRHWLGSGRSHHRSNQEQKSSERQRK